MDAPMHDVAGQANTRSTSSLLWSACRPEPDLDGTRAAVDAGADLERAANAALDQRVSGLLWRAFEAAGVEMPGASWSEQLHGDAVRCRAQAMLLLPRFASAAFTPLVDAGLEPLVIKGASLADRYPAPGLRPMDDVDVVLPKVQHRRAVEVLCDAGWQLVHGPGPSDHSSALVHAGLPGLPLELHESLGTWRDRGLGPTSEHLWLRRRSRTIAGAPAFGLEPEDELAMLVAHAGKPDHRFRRLIWIVDLVVVAGTAGRPIDWDRVGDAAARAGYRTVLAVALSQAARLGLATPARLREPPARGMRARALAPLFADDWPLTGPAGMAELLRYVLVDRHARQVALLVGNATRVGIARAPVYLAASGRRALGRWRRLRSTGAEDGNGALEP